MSRLIKFTWGQRRCGQRCLPCGDRAGHTLFAAGSARCRWRRARSSPSSSPSPNRDGITIDIAEEEPDEEAMKEAGDLGVPFIEPDHDGEEWEEWVDWSAPAVGA